MTEPDGPAGPPPRRRPDARWWRLGGVAVCVAGLVWGASVLDATPPGGSAEGDGAAAAGAAPGPGTLVSSAALACPGPELVGLAGGGDEVAQAVDVAAALAPTRVGAADGGAATDDSAGDPTADPTASLGPLAEGPDASAARSLDLVAGATEGAPGQAVLPVDGPAGAVSLATGAAAPGLTAGQVGLSTGSGTRGLTLTACQAPAESTWLVGGGDAPGRTEQLVLNNPGADAVTVEVDVWGADGPAERTGANATVVPGGGRVVQLLDALATPVGSPVVRVTSRGGPVVAHLGEHEVSGTVDLGAEMVGPAAAPASDLVVPAVAPGALPDGPASVVLRLAAPTQPAVVELTALTADGAVRLPGQVTRVASGTTVDVTLEDLPDGVLALRLRSDAPVTAGARLHVAPAGDEPLEPTDDVIADTATSTDTATTTDAAARTDEVASTDSPAEDEVASTDAPPGRPAPDDPPLLHPAGENAWVAATTPSTTPLGVALPARDGIPEAVATLAVSVVDATEVTVHQLVADGTVRTTELGRVPNDTTRTVDIGASARAVWVTTQGEAGAVASVIVTGADRVGPYLAATTLPAVPWTRPVAEVTVVGP